MLPKERVKATFAGKQTDKIAVHHIGFSSAVASMILGREAFVGGGIQQWREATALWNGADVHAEFLDRSHQDAFDLAMAIGNDIVRMEYWRLNTKPTRQLDDHTFLYGDPEKQWQLRRFEPETELYQIVEQHPEQDDSRDMAWLESYVDSVEQSLERFHPTVDSFSATQELIDRYGSRHTVRVAGGGLGLPYAPLVWLEATLLRPDLVERYLNAQAERAARSIPYLAASGAEYLFGGSDFASNDGPFYSPKVFHQLMLPPLKRICEVCHQHGIRYLFASDGNLWPLADDLFGESGVDGYYEIDGRAGMDLATLRQRYPHLTQIGNISSHTLHLGSQEEVIAEVESCLKTARDGGILVGVSNYLLPGTPSKNVETLLDRIEKGRE